MKLLAFSVPHAIRNSTDFFEGAKASPVCASDNNIIKMKISMEQWWNYTDREKPKYWEKNMYQSFFIHHKYDVD